MAIHLYIDSRTNRCQLLNANHFEAPSLLHLTNKREWVKARLREEGSSLARVAKELGVTPSAVTHALSGRHRSPHIIQAIALRIGIHPDEILSSDEGGAHPKNKP
jgi:lambda repressor-like predicted transcriptional regulator